MGKDTIVVGVRTPGVSTIVRQQHKLAAPEWLSLSVAEKGGTVMRVLKTDGRGMQLSSFGAGHHHITCFVAVRVILVLRSLRCLHSRMHATVGQDPTEDAVFTGGRRGEVRAWNYKTGADLWQSTRLARDPANRRRRIVPGKDPNCTLLVYGIGDFDAQKLGDVLVGRQLVDSKPQWASVCSSNTGGNTDVTRWALVGVATPEIAQECIARCNSWTPDRVTADSRSIGDDGRPLKAFLFDPVRADERDLLGFGAMRMMRQDRGQPVTALALRETQHAQWIFASCEDTSVRAINGETGAPLWTFSGYSGPVHAMGVSSRSLVCGVGSSVLSLDILQRHATKIIHNEHALGSYTGHLGDVMELQMTEWADDTSPESRAEILVTGSVDRSVRALRVQKSGQLELLWSFPGLNEAPGRAREFRGAITALSIVPQDDSRDFLAGNSIVIAGSKDHTVRALDGKTGAHLWCFPELLEYQGEKPQSPTQGSEDRGHEFVGANLRIGHSGAVTAIATVLSVPTGDGDRSSNLVLTGSADHSVCALSLRTGEQRWCFRGCKGAVTGLAVTETACLVLASDHVLRALDLRTGNQHWSFQGRQTPITAMAVSQHQNRFTLLRSREPPVGKLAVVEAGPLAIGHGQNQTIWVVSNTDGRLKVSREEMERMKIVANEGSVQRAIFMGPGETDALFSELAKQAALDGPPGILDRSSGADVAVRDDVAHTPDRVDKEGRFCKPDLFRISQRRLEDLLVNKFGEDYRLLIESTNACEVCLQRRPLYGELQKEGEQAVPLWCETCARNQQIGACVVDDKTTRWHHTISWRQQSKKHWLFEGQSGLVNGLALLPGIPRTRVTQGAVHARHQLIDVVDVAINVSQDCTVRAMNSSTGAQMWVFSGHATSVEAAATVDQGTAQLILKQLDQLEDEVDSSSLEALRDSPSTSTIFQEVADLYPMHIAVLMSGVEDRRHQHHDKSWHHKESEIKAALKSAVRCLLPATIVTGDRSAGEAAATIRSLSEGGQELWMFDGHSGDITALAFAKPQAKRRRTRLNEPLHVFSGSVDTTVRCLHSVTGNQLWCFDGHNEKVTAIATNPDYVFSGAADHTVRCLDIRDGTQIWVFRHSEQVTAIAADRRFLYMGDKFGSIALLPAQTKGSGAVVRPEHLIADAHTTAITELSVCSHRFTGRYLYSASDRIVLSPLRPITLLGIVTYVQLEEAGDVIAYSTRVLKPLSQFLGRAIGRLAAALQIASFAFTPETVPELPPEFQATITFFGDFALDLGGYDQAFAIAMAVSVALVAALVTQENIEFNQFMNPAMVRYKLQWATANAIVALSAGILFIPVIKTEVRVLDCSKKHGAWYFDAKSQWSISDGSGNALDIDETEAVECGTVVHMAYAVAGVVMMFLHILFTMRLQRVYTYMELLEVRPNLLDFRGDSKKKLPAEHGLSIERGEHAMIEVLCKVVIVASKVLGATSLIAATFLFFASGVLLIASFRIPPYYGFQYNRLLFALHFLVFWMCGTTLGALWDRFKHPNAKSVQEGENSWWIDVPLVYLSFPLAIIMFLVVPYIPYSFLYEVRWAKKKKEAEEEKNALKFKSDEHRPHVLSWIDSNHDGSLGREELDRLLLLAGNEKVDDDTYYAMCAEVGVVDPDKGITSTQFAELLAQMQQPNNKWDRNLPESIALHKLITSIDLEATVLLSDKHGYFNGDKRGKRIKKDLVQYGHVVRCTVRIKRDGEQGESWALVTMGSAAQARLVVDATPYDGARFFSVATAQSSTGLLKGLSTRHLSHPDVAIAECRLAKDERSIRRRTPEEWDAIEHARRDRARSEKYCLSKVLDWIDRNHDGVIGRNEINRLIEAMHWEPLSDNDYERMCLAVGANDQADAWYWLDQVSDTWVPYSETDAQKLENGFRDWSGDTELVVDVDFCKLSPNRPIHRVHMTRLKEANGKNFSVNFIERAIIYDDKDDTEHRSRRLQQSEGKDGTPVRRGLGFTKNQFRSLQRLKHSEERRLFRETLEFLPDHQDSGILTRRGFDKILREAWKPPSDKQYAAMCQAIWKHTEHTETSEQEFTADLQRQGFTWDQLVMLQESHDWDNHNWRTGVAEMFLPSTDTLFKAVQAIQNYEKEDACRTKILQYLDRDSNNELQLTEVQELLELSGDESAVLDVSTYNLMIEEAGGDVSKGVLTMDEFERLLTDYQEQGWVGSCTDLHSALVERGKLDPDELGLKAGSFDSDLAPHDAVMRWVDGDLNGKINREELNKLLAACRGHITDDEWRVMCNAGGADPKVGFNKHEFERLQRATFTFTHSWLPSSTELYGAILELHGEVDLYPDPVALQRGYTHSHLKEALASRPFGGSISQMMMAKVFEHIGRPPLTDDEYEQLCEKVQQSSHRDTWFYFNEHLDGAAIGTYHLEWVPYGLVDCQALNNAIATSATLPLRVTISNGHVVDLSSWATSGIATQSASGGRDYAVQRGAGLTAKALIYLAKSDPNFPSPLDICSGLHVIAQTITDGIGRGGLHPQQAIFDSEFVNPVAIEDEPQGLDSMTVMVTGSTFETD